MGLLQLLGKFETPQLHLARSRVLAMALAAASLMAPPIIVQSLAQETGSPDSASDSPDEEVAVEVEASDGKKASDQPTAITTLPRTIAGFVSGPKGAIPGVKATVTLSVQDKSHGAVVGLAVGKTLKELVYETGRNGRYTIRIPAELSATPDLLISVKLTHPKYLERVMGAIPVSDFANTQPKNARPRGILRSMAKNAIRQSRLRLAHRIEGRVLLADGSPAAGAQVKSATKYRAYSWKFFSADDYGFSSSATTDQDGRFSLVTDGRATLTAMLRGQAPLLVGNLQEHLKLANGDGNVFRFPPGIRLKGRILDDRGQPVPRAVITARRHFAWNESNMPLSFQINCAANELGQYQLPPLPADQYRLSFTGQLTVDSKPDEYNKFLSGFNTTAKPEYTIEGLPLVFVPVIRELKFTEPRPQLDLQASEMVTVKVNVEFPDGADPNRNTDVGIAGLMNGNNWQGSYAKADRNGIAILRAPKGLRLASIKTGLARHRRAPDADVEIGEAIHLGELKGDRDGFTVIKPKFAKLKVKLTLPDELSRKISKSKTFISITGEYERKGYRENSPTPQRLILTGSTQSGPNSYRGTALPNEPILLKVSLQENGKRTTILEEKLTLRAGEERDHQLVIAFGEAEAAKQRAVDNQLRKQVEQAATKAVGYLLKEQRSDGSWSSGMASDTHQVGATAMIALAIFDSGSNSDRAVQAATQYLLKASPRMTKEIALQTLFLHRIGKPGAAILRRNLQWLVDAQIKKGPDAGSWSYVKDSAGSRGDGANTAYAILALSASASTDEATAERDNVVPMKVWQRAQSWLLKSQKADGGWGYVTRVSQTTGAMTACGLASLKKLEFRLEKSPAGQDAVKRAQSWLNTRWSTKSNPQGTRAWRMFYLHWASLALRDQAKLGDRDWRSEILEQLLHLQQKDGSFRAESSSSAPAISTAFALEILKLSASAKPD